MQLFETVYTKATFKRRNEWFSELAELGYKEKIFVQLELNSYENALFKKYGHGSKNNKELLGVPIAPVEGGGQEVTLVDISEFLEE